LAQYTRNGHWFALTTCLSWAAFPHRDHMPERFLTLSDQVFRPHSSFLECMTQLLQEAYHKYFPVSNIILDICFLLESGVQCRNVLFSRVQKILLRVLSDNSGIRLQAIDVCARHHQRNLLSRDDPR
jgi:membrane-associated PAP2 superfamily phosphatase